MKRLFCLLCLILAGLSLQVQAQQPQLRLIVRDKLGLSGLTQTCKLIGCSVVRNLGDTADQLFLVTIPNNGSVSRLLQLLSITPSIAGIEVDQLLGLPQPPTLASIPQT